MINWEKNNGKLEEKLVELARKVQEKVDAGTWDNNIEPLAWLSKHLASFPISKSKITNKLYHLRKKDPTIPDFRNVVQKMRAKGKKVEGEPVTDAERFRYEQKILDLGDQMNILKKQLIIARRERIQHEHILTALREMVPQLPIIKQIPIPRPVRPKGYFEVPYSPWGDHHGGRTVSYEETEGYNEYNFQIFCDRLWTLVTKIIGFTQNHTMWTTDLLYLDFLGDLAQNAYRVDDLRTNEFPEAMMILAVACVEAQAIASLFSCFKQIEMHCVVGNEGRFDKQVKTSKQTYNRYDWLIYQIISIYLANYIKADRLKMHIYLSPKKVVEKLGWKFLLMHCDTIKGSTWGISEYGLRREEAKQQAIRRKRGGFDYLVGAHFHTFEAKKNRIRTGTLVGADEYSHGDLGLNTNVSQTLCSINKEFGVTDIIEVRCEKTKKSPFKFSQAMVAGELLAEELNNP